MTPTKCDELLAKVKDALMDELDESDFEFDLGFTEQSFPEQNKELALDNNLIAEVSYIANGYRQIDRGDYYTPPSESGEISVCITCVEVWNEDGEKVYENKSPDYKTNSFTIKY